MRLQKQMLSFNLCSTAIAKRLRFFVKRVLLSKARLNGQEQRVSLIYQREARYLSRYLTTGRIRVAGQQHMELR